MALEVVDTGSACRIYNVLLAEGRRVAAALVRSSSMTASSARSREPSTDSIRRPGRDRHRGRSWPGCGLCKADRQPGRRRGRARCRRRAGWQRLRSVGGGFRGLGDRRGRPASPPPVTKISIRQPRAGVSSSSRSIASGASMRSSTMQAWSSSPVWRKPTLPCGTAWSRSASTLPFISRAPRCRTWSSRAMAGLCSPRRDAPCGSRIACPAWWPIRRRRWRRSASWSAWPPN